VIAGGPPARVLDKARAKIIDLLVPDLVLDELVRVLGNKLSWDREALEQLDREIRALATAIPIAPETAAPLSGDPDDDRILACAVTASADVLVSGDRRHLLPLSSHGGVRIIRPQDLLAELDRS
jgi:uncharacterized protein